MEQDLLEQVQKLDDNLVLAKEQNKYLVEMVLVAGKVFEVEEEALVDECRSTQNYK